MKKYVDLLEIIMNETFDLNDVEIETQNKAYDGFSLPTASIRSRCAKKTPKKAGYFVTHYVKDGNSSNRPYTTTETLDTLAIFVPNKGVFLLPKETLIQHGIVTDAQFGKMGFRIYLPTETELNRTAQKTQAWQAPYFHSYNQSCSMNTDHGCILF